MLSANSQFLMLARVEIGDFTRLGVSVCQLHFTSGTLTWRNPAIRALIARLRSST